MSGPTDPPEQKFVAQHLQNDRRLHIPVALAMSMTEGVIGRCKQRQNELYSRYWRLNGLSYAEMKDLVSTSANIAALRGTILQRTSLPEATRRTDWDDASWYLQPNGEVDSYQNIELTFQSISFAIQANCDVRDFGKLNLPEMSVSDSDWRNVNDVPIERLNMKLKDFSFVSIAALNYAACDDKPMAALARAYGVSAGVLPTIDSKSPEELLYTTARIPPAAKTSIQEFMSNTEVCNLSLALNMLSMFALFHLSYDHAFGNYEPKLTGKVDKYIRSLRTMKTISLVDEDFQMNKELIIRTVAHPFGLAQTYWLALVMHKCGMILPALGVFVNLTPSPVQIIEVVRSTCGVWANIYFGKMLNQVYKNQLDLVNITVAEIKKNPPAYSILHGLFGIEKQEVPGDDAMAAVDIIMPCIYGYAKVLDRYGIAPTLNLNAIARDEIDKWTMLWQNFWCNDGDVGDLVDFARKSMCRGPVKMSPKLSETVKGKLSIGAKIIQKGGRENIFKHLFGVIDNEKLLKASQCYLSTTAGPIAGILFISTHKVAFCSERSITLPVPSGGGTTLRTPYKVSIPLGKIQRANESENVEKPEEKYIAIDQ